MDYERYRKEIKSMSDIELENKRKECQVNKDKTSRIILNLIDKEMVFRARRR